MCCPPLRHAYMNGRTLGLRKAQKCETCGRMPKCQIPQHPPENGRLWSCSVEFQSFRAINRTQIAFDIIPATCSSAGGSSYTSGLNEIWCSAAMHELQECWEATNAAEGEATHRSLLFRKAFRQCAHRLYRMGFTVEELLASKIS